MGNAKWKKEGDEDGEWAWVRKSGKLVTDYTIVNTEAKDKLTHIEIVERIESVRNYIQRRKRIHVEIIVFWTN